MNNPNLEKLLLSLKGETIKDVTFLYDDDYNALDYIHIQTTDDVWYSIEANRLEALNIAILSKENIEARIKFYNQTE